MNNPPDTLSAEQGNRRDSFATLKAWVFWVLKNPIDEHQEAHAKATNDLFALLGSREAQLAKAQAALLRERERSRGLVEAPGRKEKCTSDEFERRAKACGYYEAPLHQKLEYLLEVKHYSLEEGADANFELFHNVLPQVIRELAAYDASHRASAKEGEKE